MTTMKTNVHDTSSSWIRYLENYDIENKMTADFESKDDYVISI